MLSNLFFLLSLHSHLGLFHPYVVVKLALRRQVVKPILFQHIRLLRWVWTISHHYVQVSLYADYFVNVRLLMTEVTSVRSRFNQISYISFRSIRRKKQGYTIHRYMNNVSLNSHSHISILILIFSRKFLFVAIFHFWHNRLNSFINNLFTCFFRNEFFD